MIDSRLGKPFPVTRRDRGGGCSTPLPVSPTPTGAIPIDTVPGDRSSLCRQREHPTEILSLSPVHCIRANRHTLPAPSGGGGRRRGTRREVGVIRRIPFNQRRRRHGREEATSREHPAEILSLSPCTVSGLSPYTARPLWRGREEARNAPGGGGGRRKPFNG